MTGDLKPATGTWFDFHHPNPYEGDYWQDTVASFTPEDWFQKVAELVSSGFETLVLMSVALDEKTFYPSEVVDGQWEMETADPLEAVLDAADEHGAEVYLGLGFFTAHTGDFTGTEESNRTQKSVAEELAERYAHHPSFHGWYLPVEAAIDEHFPPGYIEYANEWADICTDLTPGKPVLIAPYGTRTIAADDRFVEQLRELSVDYIAYQDEVGVEKAEVEDLDAIYSRLRDAHDSAEIPLWADIEFFEFEGNVYDSSLVPAPFDRVEGQLESVTPHVEKALCYQYWGLMNPPESSVHAGHPSSVDLYETYQEWRKQIA